MYKCKSVVSKMYFKYSLCRMPSFTFPDAFRCKQPPYVVPVGGGGHLNNLIQFWIVSFTGMTISQIFMFYVLNLLLQDE